MAAPTTGTRQLVAELRQSLHHLTPAPADPLLAAFWDGVLGLTNFAGARLLEARFGSDIVAASEVQSYLFHLERVSPVVADAPLRLPQHAVNLWNAIARLATATEDSAELLAFLTAIPEVGQAVSSYASRILGTHATPITSVLDLMVRAGDVYLDALSRTRPELAHQ